MAGYTYKWDCRICKEHQDTIMDSKLQICSKCLERLAEALCNKKLMHSINDNGIDKEYWMAEAYNLATVLFRRWVPERLSNAVHV